jgi:ElaB/YqjD/DUF883 family membrane-anchored ribosome-binding protein
MNVNGVSRLEVPQTQRGTNQAQLRLFSLQLPHDPQGALRMADRTAAAARSIEDDLAALRDDVKNLSASIAALARQKTGEVKDELGYRTDQALETGRQAAETVQDAVKERPMTSVCIAFGIGVMIGHLLYRR